MKLSAKVRYALAALFELSRFPNDALTSDQIAAKCDIPAAFAQKVLNALARNGLAVSRKGLGYRLAKPLSGITALAVVQAMNQRAKERPDGDALDRLERKIDRVLAETTLDRFPQD